MIRATKLGPIRMSFVSPDQVNLFSYGCDEEPLEESFAINRVGYRFSVTAYRNQETDEWYTKASNNYIRRRDGGDRFNIDHLDKITSMCLSTVNIHLATDEGKLTLARAKVRQCQTFIKADTDKIEELQKLIEERERERAVWQTSLAKAEQHLLALESNHGTEHVDAA